MDVYTLTTVAVIVTGAGQAVSDDLEADDAGVDRTCLLVPGDIAWDSCDCGQLAQTVTSVSPSSAFPTVSADTPQTPCGPNQMIVNVTLSLVRCVTGVDENGNPPPCDVLLAEAVRLERDRFIARRAVRCYLQELYDALRLTGFSVGTSTSVGPEGLCGGSELTYSFGIGAAGCC